MQFKHPELLYLLFLLLIPIFIHLFQLRRFQKVAFTNVAFLKKVTLQTRKSSQLKKWLTLLMRLLALACIILAFAQPFSASKTALNTEKETVLYIDNSFSMQAKGSEGPLLQRTLQQLYSQDFDANSINWFTNNISKKDASIQDFKNEILAVPYSQNQLSLKNVLLKANLLFSEINTAEKRLILVSDFQGNGSFPDINPTINTAIVHLKGKDVSNVSIDSAYVLKKNSSTLKLKVVVSAQGSIPENIPISLFNNDQLISKTAVNFPKESSENKTSTVTFDINNITEFNGKLSLNDPNLQFDNTLYFTLNKNPKIKVLALNGGDSNYLQRIFNPEEFFYTQQNSESFNYSDFENQHIIILNELLDIPESLPIALKSFSENGGSIIVIPSNNIKIEDYNLLLNKLAIGSFSELINQEKKVTQIVFEHPIYKNVFEKKVVNFQYPKVNYFYAINSSSPAILRFEDGKPFVIQNKNTYLFTAAINNKNSNFKSSPLIVPTINNMATHSLQNPKIYFEIGKLNHFSIPVQLGQDEIVTIKDSISSFIPLQQSKANQVTITTENTPSVSGVYTIYKDIEALGNISFNYNRNESILHYSNPENWKGVEVYDSINELFDTISKENTINNYWKWFVIFTLLFLIVEMMILKFLKN